MIKVTVDESAKESKPFPKLMKDKASMMIVLFVRENKGFVVRKAEGESFDIGHVSGDWDMSYFEDYNEPVTLQNE